MVEVIIARHHAVDKHGPLKPGADRWSRLIAEEWEEVEDELSTLYLFDPQRLENQSEWNKTAIHSNARKAAIAELAQLAQLCIGVIELLQAEEATHVSTPST